MRNTTEGVVEAKAAKMVARPKNTRKSMCSACPLALTNSTLPTNPRHQQHIISAHALTLTFNTFSYTSISFTQTYLIFTLPVT